MLPDVRAKVAVKKTALPKTVPLLALIELTGEDRQQLHRLCGAHRSGADYDLAASIHSLISHYKTKAEKVSESKAADAAARERAERIKAEIETAALLEKTMLREQVEKRMDDLTAQIRIAVAKSKLPEKVKIEIGEIMAGVKLSDDQ
jgi:hypothetical protein